VEEFQTDLDVWVKQHNEERPHSGKDCIGKTLMQDLLDSIPLAKEKVLDYNLQAVAYLRKYRQIK
jgi:hypothetical protein